tara:strand:- start:99 stop:764 length:666 start_codon:yes stop_codon:yes gene_type:complete
MKNISLELPLKNLVRAPKPTSEKSPAIFFLHGFGSNMEDLYSLSSSFPKEWACISLQASIPIELNGWAWADLNFENLSKLPDPDQMRKHQRMVTASIKKSVEELNLDRKRINLLGFSQGASLAIYSGLMNVDLFSTITALCGFMPLEEIGNEIEDKDLSSINLFMGNGIQDPVVAIERAEKTFKNLTDLGITPQFKKYNAEHTISYECLQDVLSFLINNNI